MKEMAGVLIGDAVAQWREPGGETKRGKKFGDVASLCGESAGLSVFGFLRRKKMIVFLERGAAARGIGDNSVEIFEREGRKISSREFTCGVAKSRVRGKGAAARLVFWHDNFAAVRGEHADSSFVEFRKSDVGDAAGEKSNARAAWPCGGKRLAETGGEKIVVDLWEK